tara:strand:+ start:205 stop:534 length:330 start_codon:yes stop_codon:yes gene_type:complete
MKINMINVVRGFITAHSDLADNDVDLTYNIWKWELNKMKPSININQISSKMLMKYWKDGTISSPYNISRSRRKCQELYPETRGETYAKRHERQENVKEDLKAAEAESKR